MIYQGIVSNQEYHLERICRSLGKSGLSDDKIIGAIRSEINNIDKFYGDICKLRVIYDNSGFISKEIVPYTYKKTSSLKIVRCNNIKYDKKYVDRSRLDDLFSKRGESDDIIIVKEGLVTDSSYTNIVLEKDGFLFTPSTPLLRGTKREKLIREGIIIEKKIHIDSLSDYKRIFLINAFRDINFDNYVDIKNINY